MEGTKEKFNKSNATKPLQTSNKPKFLFSIGARFIGLIVLVSILTAVATSFILLNLSRDSIHEKALETNLAQAKIIASFSSSYMDTVQAHIAVFANRPDVTKAVVNNTPEQLQPVLAEFVQVQTKLDTVGIYDTDGIQRAYSIVDSANIGQSFADREWYQEVMATGKAFQSSPVISRGTGNIIIPYAVPILDGQGEILGILTGAISLNSLSDSFINVDFGNDTGISIIDIRDGGIILVDADPERIMQPVSGQNEAVNRLLSGESGTIETTGINGELDLIGYASVPDLPWGIMVSTPSTTALMIFNALNQSIIISAFFIVISAIALGTILVIGVTRPLRRLVEDTKEIGRGNLDIEVNVSANDEIGDLSRAFAEMVKNLKHTLVSRDKLAEEVAEREKAEESLINSEVRYRRLFETAQDAILILNGDTGKIIDANPFIKDLLGYNMGELVGKNLWEIGSLKDTPASKLSYKELHETGYVRYEHLPLITKDGRKIDVEVVANTYPVDNQRIIQCNIRDITERKKAEEENRRLRESIEISNRLAAIGGMAAGIAHEINNPLTGVSGFSQLLTERKDLPDDVMEDLKIIADGSNRVKEIVRRMLTFAHQTKPMKAVANINELIEATLDLRDYVLKTANIEVIKHLDPHLPWLMVDSGQMQQVFLNIIVNAEYSMKKAHGKGELIVTTEEKNKHIRISFKDDGAGISQEIINKLYHPFFTTKEVGEGTGLGLSLSRSIIEEHGGTIEVESQSEQGANFIITLPMTLVAEEKPVEADGAAVSLETIKTGHILVVDDEEAIRKLISMILSQSGHIIDATGDTKDALVKLESTSFDAILMDIRMPGMGGMELYNIVIKKYPEISKKFIFITGDTSDMSIRDFLEQNKLAYITKPFDRETLLKKVNYIIRVI